MEWIRGPGRRFPPLREQNYLTSRNPKEYSMNMNRKEQGEVAQGGGARGGLGFDSHEIIGPPGGSSCDGN